MGNLGGEVGEFRKIGKVKRYGNRKVQAHETKKRGRWRWRRGAHGGGYRDGRRWRGLGRGRSENGNGERGGGGVRRGPWRGRGGDTAIRWPVAAAAAAA